MGNGELPTPPGRPQRHQPLCPTPKIGTLWTATPEGSRTCGTRPDRPNGPPQATRHPKTARGYPSPTTQHPLTNVDESGTVRDPCRVVRLWSANPVTPTPIP